MRIHSLQHVAFEDLANIKVWAGEKGHAVTRTLLFRREPLPSLDEIDCLVVMGGPMSVGDEKEYPWLADEKKFIERALKSGKRILGICLGAQLLAEVLGGRVYKNQHKEIGWHPVSLSTQGKQSAVFSVLPPEFTAFHWHGDTFDLPLTCVRLASSEGCLNQAFEYGPNVLGLQFHLESSPESIQALIENCGGDMTEGKYVQSAQEILAGYGKLPEIYQRMNQLLDRYVL